MGVGTTGHLAAERAWAEYISSVAVGLHLTQPPKSTYSVQTQMKLSNGGKCLVEHPYLVYLLAGFLICFLRHGLSV